jgi:hypothetical protein
MSAGSGTEVEAYTMSAVLGADAGTGASRTASCCTWDESPGDSSARGTAGTADTLGRSVSARAAVLGPVALSQEAGAGADDPINGDASRGRFGAVSQEATAVAEAADYRRVADERVVAPTAIPHDPNGKYVSRLVTLLTTVGTVLRRTIFLNLVLLQLSHPLALTIIDIRTPVPRIISLGTWTNSPCMTAMPALIRSMLQIA